MCCEEFFPAIPLAGIEDLIYCLADQEKVSQPHKRDRLPCKGVFTVGNEYAECEKQEFTPSYINLKPHSSTTN